MPNATAALQVLEEEAQKKGIDRYLRWAERTTRGKSPSANWLEEQQSARLSSAEATLLRTSMRLPNPRVENPNLGAAAPSIKPRSSLQLRSSFSINIQESSRGSSKASSTVSAAPPSHNPNHFAEPKIGGVVIDGFRMKPGVVNAQATGMFGGPGDWTRRRKKGQVEPHKQDWGWCIQPILVGGSPGDGQYDNYMLNRMSKNTLSLPTLPATGDHAPPGHVVKFGTFSKTSRTRSSDFAQQSLTMRTNYRHGVRV